MWKGPQKAPTIGTFSDVLSMSANFKKTGAIDAAFYTPQKVKGDEIDFLGKFDKDGGKNFIKYTKSKQGLKGESPSFLMCASARGLAKLGAYMAN